LIQIQKKGDKRKRENYRGINITKPFIKIPGNLIKNGEKNVIKEMRNKVISLKDDQL
jgi:hypothetical protein